MSQLRPDTGGSRLYPALAVTVLAVAFAATVWKAWTLSITIDEAFTSNIWVTAPFRAFYTVRGYNNHPLNTLLCRLSVAVFGLSEISLRLPSLLLGLVYLVAIYRLARLFFGRTGWLLLAVAVNAANPLILDHFSTARGYGMGLALWTLGAWYAARWVVRDGYQDGGAWVLAKAGASMGLAVAAYMTEAFAVAALGASLLLIYLVEGATRGGWAGTLAFLRRCALPFCSAALAAALPIMWGPLRLARPGEIDGPASYRDAVKAFLDMLLFYSPAVLSDWPAGWKLLHKWPWAVLLLLLGALAASAAVVAWRWGRRRGLGKLVAGDRLLLLFGTAVPLMFLLLRFEPVVFQHAFFGERRLLFTLPPLMLACPLWLHWLGAQGTPGRLLMRAGAAVLVLLGAHLAWQFTPRSFAGWEFDAGAKAMAGVLRERRPPAGRTVQIAGSWFIEHSTNFYRRRYGLDWIVPLHHAMPVCFPDYYIVFEDELAQMARFEPVVLYRDPVARTVLAEPGGEVRARLLALKEAGFQRIPACTSDLTRREAWVDAGRPGAKGHFLADVMEAMETDPRWTYERPAYLFDVPARSGLRLSLEVRLSPVTYRQTGPVRLTVWVNGHRLGELPCNSPEDHRFDQPVPPAWFRSDGLALVETTMDKYYVAPEDGRKLGYLFARGGFRVPDGRASAGGSAP